MEQEGADEKLSCIQQFVAVKKTLKKNTLSLLHICSPYNQLFSLSTNTHYIAGLFNSTKRLVFEA